MAQQNNGNPPHPNQSYPSPHSYPSPSMAPYAFQGGPGQPMQVPGPQNMEQYRASPTGSNTSISSGLNLPPIRSIDPRQPQPAQPQQPQQQTMQGSPLPPGMGNMAPMGGYYPHPGQTLAPQQHIGPTSSPIPGMPIRYPLPTNDTKIMTGGRHKKEVKRRTKTGCLTCRKRRIKCDEGHPTCRNCKKSKRECLGYDPIFKAQPSPASIQPAPNSSSHPPTNQAYPPPPPGYVPAQNFPPNLSTSVDSPNSSLGPFDYGAPIDPALEGSSQMAAPNTLDGGQAFDPVARPEAIPFPAPTYRQNQRAKRIKIDDLFALNNVPLKAIPPPSSVSAARMEEIKDLYRNTYAPQIDRFLEVHWFTMKGWNRLLSDTTLCSRISTLIDSFSVPPNPQNPDPFSEIRSLEASVVWALMSIASSVIHSPSAPNTGSTNGLNAKDNKAELADIKDATERLTAIEALLTGQYLEINPITSTGMLGNVPGLQEQMKSRVYRFWHSLGHFLTLHDADANSTQDVENVLSTCRVVLDNFENRDVIYSVAVARHLGGRFPEFPHSLPPPTINDEKDDQQRIAVAKRFIEDEAAGRGTTQVIQRICGMVMRSWYLSR